MTLSYLQRVREGLIVLGKTNVLIICAILDQEITSVDIDLPLTF